MRHRSLSLWLCLFASAPVYAQAYSAPPLLAKGPIPFSLLRQSWIEDLEAHRLLSSVGHYSPDADFLSGDGSHAEGLAAIRQLYSSVFERFDAAITMTSRVTSQSGDLAYDSGSYSEQITDRTSHQALSLHGDYLTVYRRLGLQWLIVQQAFTQASDAPGTGQAR